MATVLAEEDATRLHAKHHGHRLAARTLCGTACSCSTRNRSQAERVANGCGGMRRGRRFKLRPRWGIFLRVNEVTLCQFWLLAVHAFLIGFSVAQRKIEGLARFWASPARMPGWACACLLRISLPQLLLDFFPGI